MVIDNNEISTDSTNVCFITTPPYCFSNDNNNSFFYPKFPTSKMPNAANNKNHIKYTFSQKDRVMIHLSSVLSPLRDWLTRLEISSPVAI